MSGLSVSDQQTLKSCSSFRLMHCSWLDIYLFSRIHSLRDYLGFSDSAVSYQIIKQKENKKENKKENRKKIKRKINRKMKRKIKRKMSWSFIAILDSEVSQVA